MINLPSELQSFLSSLSDISKPYLVGGCVRDSLLGIEPKDWDIEIFDVPFEKLEASLTDIYGSDKVVSCGKSFGVLKVKLDTLTVDAALPRTEEKTGLGYKCFEVTTNPNLSLKEACSRRDFTINALMYDPQTEQALDFFGGESDLKYHILRAVSPSSFVEDPLRLLRGFQFCARFGLVVEENTKKLAKQITKEEWKSLAPDRIWCEWEKFLNKGTELHLGLQALVDLNILQYYPELEALVGSEQNPVWHPEGDVWVHTKFVCAYAGYYTKDFTDLVSKKIVRLACLCHDLGKPETQTINVRGTISNPRHGNCTETVTNFLNRIYCPVKYHSSVQSLVKEHLNWSPQKGQEVLSDKAILALVNRLVPSTLTELTYVVRADISGRPPLPIDFPKAMTKLLIRACELGVNPNYPGVKPLVTGEDLKELGFVEGAYLGATLKQAKKMQINHPDWTKEKLLKWVDSNTKRGSND